MPFLKLIYKIIQYGGDGYLLERNFYKHLQMLYLPLDLSDVSII